MPLVPDMARFFSTPSFRFLGAVSALVFCFQVIIGTLFALPVFAAASPVNIISYQGRLLNSNRVPLSSASASVVFELYTASLGGACAWSNSSSTCASATARTVTLTDGLFSENLGDTAAAVPYAAIPDTIFGNNASLYLQITVNGETLSPRKYISAAPYALNAQMLDGLNSDADGSTAAALVALNSSGNLVVTGNPSGSGISNGSFYVNPATGDVAANDVLLGVAVSGTAKFFVDAEGDATIGGILSVGSNITSFGSTIDFFDDATGASTLDIGGVTSDRANTINIATNATQGDTIRIGNVSAGTTLAIAGGTAWSIDTAGSASFSDVACTDCLSWTEFTDSGSLDSSTLTVLGDHSLTFNVSGLGNFLTTNAQGDVLTISADGGFNYRLNSTQNPGFTISNQGAGNVTANLSGAGDFVVQDNGITFFTLSDAGAYDFLLDSSDNPAYTITNNGSGNVVTNLVGNGDFVVQTGGSAFATFNNTGVVSFNDPLVVSSSDRMGQTTWSSLVTGNWAGALGNRGVSVAQISADYQANEAVGTDGTYKGLDVIAQISNNGDLNSLYGVMATATNNSLDASAIEANLVGVAGFAGNHQAVTLPNVFGLLGQVSASAGTITTGYGAVGQVTSGAGSFTTAIGGYFESLNEGTTRIGVHGSASGGTNNYAGYFTQALVQVDDNLLPTDTTPSNIAVGGGGDLYITDSFEGDGSMYMGDTTGTDEFVFTSALTNQAVFAINADSLTSGSGLRVLRSNSVATDFSGNLVDIQQNRTSAGTTGTALAVRNFGGGNSSAMYVVQDQVANATTTPTAQALVIDVNEAANSDEVILIRSDADGGGVDTEFRFENDGDFFGDGAAYNTGADYAEFFPTTDASLGDYDVVCWNGAQANGVKRCGAGDTNVVGVISVNPAFVGNNFVGAGGTLEGNDSYAMVGLVGQLDTHVSTESGAIHIGDPITTSPTRAGYGVKASGGTYIIGRALESLTSGTGTIKVLVQPMWYGGDVLTMDGEAQTFTGDVSLVGAAASASAPAVDSAGLSFVGSRWTGSGAEDVTLTLRYDLLSGGESRLALANTYGEDVVTFGSTGDLAIAGNLYPSDRGVLQYGAYVYYDSTGAGYMKTNATGWAARSSGYSESFASLDVLAAGDVVAFADDGSVVQASGVGARDRIAGVVSLESGFVAGSGAYPVTISGRVTTKVTAENGAIVAGDPLTVSSQPGYAMKATQAGDILGYALGSLDAGEGSMLVFVRPQYFAGEGSVAPVSSVALGSQDIEDLNVSGVLSMNGGDIVNVGSLSGIGTWEIRENGDIVTNGQLTQVVESLQHVRVSTYATTSTESVVQLAGTATLHGGIARVTLEHEDPNFNDVISPEDTYRVLVTPNGVTGQLYVTDRSNAGFIIRDASGAEGISVDWLVLAYRHDAVPDRMRETSDVSEEAVGGDDQLLPFQDGSDVVHNDEAEDIPQEAIDLSEGVVQVDEGGEVLPDDGASVPPAEDDASVEEVLEDGGVSETPLIPEVLPDTPSDPVSSDVVL